MEQVQGTASGSATGGVEALLRQILEKLNATPGIDKLARAYVLAWGEMGDVLKNSTNPHFGSDYADLKAVLDTMRPVFQKHELALLQAPGVMSADGTRIQLPGVLMHSSGQHLGYVTELPIGPKATAQAAGSAITYARRYQAQAIGGIAPTDDDGEAASASPPARSRTPSPRGGGQDEVTAADLTERLNAVKSADELKALRDAVQELADEKVAKLYVTKLNKFKPESPAKK